MALMAIRVPSTVRPRRQRRTNSSSTTHTSGLPRLPSGLAQQAFDAGNKLLFKNYVSLSAAGVYQNATTLGSGGKYFRSAFETA